MLNGVTLFDSSAQDRLLPPQRRPGGYLFQQYALFPQHDGAAEHPLRHPLRTRPAKKPPHCRRPSAAFSWRGLEKRYPASGGQQQRVAPKFLAPSRRPFLLDEPFSALDSYLKWDLELKLSDFLGEFLRTDFMGVP